MSGALGADRDGPSRAGCLMAFDRCPCQGSQRGTSATDGRKGCCVPVSRRCWPSEVSSTAGLRRAAGGQDPVAHPGASLAREKVRLAERGASLLWPQCEIGRSRDPR